MFGMAYYYFLQNAYWAWYTHYYNIYRTQPEYSGRDTRNIVSHSAMYLTFLWKLVSATKKKKKEKKVMATFYLTILIFFSELRGLN